MSFAAETIARAVRHVMEGASGSVRVLASGTYRSGLFAELPEGAKRAKALLCQHSFDTYVVATRAHAGSPVSALGSYKLVTADLLIRVTTKTSTTVQEAARYATLAAIASDCDQAIQALTRPGNLDADGDGNPTGIVSGMLAGPGDERSPTWSIQSQDWQALEVVSAISASCILRVQQDVSTAEFMNGLFGASLRCWYRADSGVVSDSDFVSQWGDLGPQDFDTIQLTEANRPPIVTGGQGGRRYIQIGATSNERLTGSHAYIAGSTEISVYVMGRFRGVTLGSSFSVFEFVRASGDFIRLRQNASGNLNTNAGDSTIQADTAFHLFRVAQSSGVQSLSVDNGTPFNASAGVTSSPVNSLNLGRATNTAPFDMYELLMIQGAPTAEQDAAVYAYCNDRYGTEIPL